MRQIFEDSGRTDASRRSLSAHEKVRRAFAAVKLRTRAALLVVGVAALVAQQGARADTPIPMPGDALPIQGGYLITGDYVVGDFAVSATEPGFKTLTVSINNPALTNADITAAFVYGEAISANTVPAPDPMDPPVPGPTGVWQDRFFDPQLQFGRTAVCRLSV